MAHYLSVVSSLDQSCERLPTTTVGRTSISFCNRYPILNIFFFVNPYLLLTYWTAAIFDARYISILLQPIFLLLIHWPPDKVLPHDEGNLVFDMFSVIYSDFV